MNLFNKLISWFGIKSHSYFDFDSYLIEINYRFISEKNGFKMYLNDEHKVYVIVGSEKEEVLICFKGKLCTKINFIPKGSTFTDLLINQTIFNLKNHGRTHN